MAQVLLCNLHTVDVRETGMFSNHKLCMYFFHEKCLQLQPNDEPFPFTLNDLTKTLPAIISKRSQIKKKHHNKAQFPE